MDDKQFEKISKAMGSELTRRRALGRLAAGVVAASGLGLAGSRRAIAQEGQAGTTLSAEKSAVGFREREITWTIDKALADGESASKTVGAGGTTSFDYIVTVDKTETDTFGVRGEICFTNGGAVATENLTIVDTVECKLPGNNPYVPVDSQNIDTGELDPGQQECYDYEFVDLTLPEGTSCRNSVQVTITNHSGSLGTPKGPNPKADFTIPTEPTIIGEDEVTVVDSEAGTLGANVNADDVFEYSIEWDGCGEFTNTAEIVETEQTDSVTVTVTGCQPPVTAQGCTPGFWKQSQHFGNWPIGRGTLVKDVPELAAFNGVSAKQGKEDFPNLGGLTLLDALSTGGGGKIALLRAAVAAVLNALSPDVNYKYTLAEIKVIVDAALNGGDVEAATALLDAANNAGCPLDRAPAQSASTAGGSEQKNTENKGNNDQKKGGQKKGGQKKGHQKKGGPKGGRK